MGVNEESSDGAYDPEDYVDRQIRDREEAEYQAGVGDGKRHQVEVELYGPELAEEFAAQDEWNRHWKHGEDY